MAKSRIFYTRFKASKVIHTSSLPTENYTTFYHRFPETPCGEVEELVAACEGNEEDHNPEGKHRCSVALVANTKVKEGPPEEH